MGFWEVPEGFYQIAESQERFPDVSVGFKGLYRRDFEGICGLK